ncbi:MAG: F420-dependent oxidoreductase, family [Acidimicrobiales bacterium]|nr:F420-dependent oxidoreductase, family [Acidimicrobiales bacterium]
MRIGIFGGDGSVAHHLHAAAQTEADGFDSYWIPQIFGADAMAVHTAIGVHVPRIELGTAVVPTYPRHPVVMASQALTVQSASGGRFALGIGLSHEWVIESMFGYSFEKPVRHMREYLSVLVPLIREGAVKFEGETLKVEAGVAVEGATPCPILVAALGEQMLKLAAAMADGTITWMTGPKTLAEHTVPTIRAAAEAAGTGDPRIVSALPVAVTDDPDAARAKAAKVFQIYGGLPSYRAMLDREGAAGPADVVIAGTAQEVRAEIQRVADAGATDFVAVEFFGDDPIRTATRDVLKSFV